MDWFSGKEKILYVIHGAASLWECNTGKSIPVIKNVKNALGSTSFPGNHNTIPEQEYILICYYLSKFFRRLFFAVRVWNTGRVRTLIIVKYLYDLFSIFVTRLPACEITVAVQQQTINFAPFDTLSRHLRKNKNQLLCLFN